MFIGAFIDLCNTTDGVYIKIYVILIWYCKSQNLFSFNTFIQIKIINKRPHGSVKGQGKILQFT